MMTPYLLINLANNMKIFKHLIIISILFLFQLSLSAKEITSQTLSSPNKSLNAIINFEGGDISYSITSDQTSVLESSPLSMTLSSGLILGKNVKLIKTERKSVKQTVTSPFYKRSNVNDEYEELILSFSGNYQIIFRAYNNGIAYRFKTNMKGEITIVNEESKFNIPGNPMVYATYINNDETDFDSQMFNSFEDLYYYKPLQQQNTGKLMTLPFLSELKDGKKLLITEIDLNDYPGMFLNNIKGQSALRGVFANYPKTREQGGYKSIQMLVTERESYIAKTNGSRNFPWRLLFVSNSDADLINSDIAYCLAESSRINDISWIKPGKVAWDWWNDWNIKNVDFRAGINNDTYKYYIDFASENGIEYIILDEGWALGQGVDLLKVIPEINLKELVDYGAKKNVGLILWAGYWAFHKDMEKVVEHYSNIGIKGFKIDFMDRDDQEMINFTYQAASVCAKYKMLINFHGIFKPTGLQRTYPNVINYEGVFGLEQMKWQPDSIDMVTHDVTFPFIRMFNGPVDYTQGAMRNVPKIDYYPSWSSPMSQGTRCRQLATYVIFDSPLSMLCDSPVKYRAEKECTQFISEIPVVWDETYILQAKVGEYIVIARRKGDVWYLGGLTNWESRTVNIELDFLEKGEYKTTLLKDGINADRDGTDYKKEVYKNDSRYMKIEMKPGGGFVAKIDVE